MIAYLALVAIGSVVAAVVAALAEERREERADAARRLDHPRA